MNDKMINAIIRQMEAMAEMNDRQREQVVLISDILQNTVRPRLEEHSGNIADIVDTLSAFNSCLQTLVGKPVRPTPSRLTVVVNNDAAGD